MSVRDPIEHWNMVMDHIGGKTPLGPTGVTNWLDGLVHNPFVLQKGLLLVGPPSSVKTTFQLAVSLLPPETSFAAPRNGLFDSGDLPHAPKMQSCLIWMQTT